MAPALLPSSVNSVPFVPGTLFCTRSENLNRYNILRKSAKQPLPSTKRVLPLATSVFLFPQFRGGFSSSHKLTLRSVSASASPPGLVVEQADSSATDANPPATDTENVPNAIGTTEESPAKDAPAQKKRTRPVRKSEMPPVKNEELVVGASFTGKVKSIQPFGAFIDFGAFTDGLVHVSQLSDTFVKEVASVVSVGQEVTVRLLEANMETGRISLTMREGDDNRKSQQSQDPSSSGDKGRRPPRNGPPKSNQMKKEGRKSSKFVKGQDLDGTVKNITRSGSFISLPDGEEGFLPTMEEEDGGIGSLMGASSMEVGKEVRVRVLRITRGQVTLTMKEEETGELDPKLMQGVVHKASNPFMLAFLQNKDISSFLDSREEGKKVTSQTADELKENITQAEAEIDGTSSKEESVKTVAVEEASNEISEAVEESTPNESTPSNEAPNFDVAEEKDAESDVSETKPEPITAEIQINTEETQAADAVEEASDEISKAVEESTPNESTPSNEAPAAFDVAEEKDAESDVPETKPDPVTSEIQISIEESQAADNEEKLEIPISSSSQTPESKTSEEETQTSDTEENPEIPISSSSQTLESETKNEEENLDIDGEKSPLQESAVAETSVSETESKSFISELTSNEEPYEAPIPQESIAEDDDSPAANTVEPERIEAVSINTSLDSDGQNGNLSIKETTVKAAISPALVKQLREETGAGMMDCKKALSETEGDLIKAQEYLRKKGLASADKKASRTTAEGRIGSYIHDSRIGILLEVNCETDFVSRGEIFKELVDDLAMQAAACPQVQYLSSEDVPQEIVDKEREIEMQKEDLLSKPEQIRSKIVDGRIKKRLDELALLEQPFIKNDKLVVKDLVKQMISTIGENIKVTRFVRYNLGEGLEKKSQDFAAEVAAQTSAKPTATPPKEQPPVAVEAVEKAPKVAVSAALVKQLREETGAGMMDCKKALAETEGDLEKAQEYLRKKGLSSADKKSSRIAAEGRIGSYIHDARIGVLIEVNCETDFVGRSEKFKELVDDLAMQVVACPQVVYVSVDDIPESVIKGEKELEMQREDLRTKPENIREKIVEGRIAKRLGEISLLEQPFIKDDSILIKDLVKQTVAALGENIKVRRFVKFTLGETAGAAAKMEDAA